MSAAAVASDPEGFVSRYLLRRRPVIIRASPSAPGADGEAALKLRAALSRSALLDSHGATRWRVSQIPYAEALLPPDSPGAQTRSLSLADFVRSSVRQFESDADAGREKDYLYHHEYLPAAAETGATETAATEPVPVARDFGSHLPSWAAELVRWSTDAQLYLGGRGAGAPLHTRFGLLDQLGHGRKQWFVSPPHQAGWSSRPAGEWVRAEYPSWRTEHAADSLTCVQEGGDAVVLPEGWAQATLHLRASVGLSREFLTGDVVSIASGALRVRPG